MAITPDNTGIATGSVIAQNPDMAAAIAQNPDLASAVEVAMQTGINPFVNMGNALMNNATNATTQNTTYGQLQSLVKGIGDKASIGLNIPVINPVAEAYQNQLLSNLTAISTPIKDPETGEITGGYFTPSTAPFVAGISPIQQQAMDFTLSGIGSYEPMLQQASSMFGRSAEATGGLGRLARMAGGLGQQAMGTAQPAAGLGMGFASDIAGIAGGLEAGGARAFDPASAGDFMSPFTQEVIDQSMQDIQREADIARQRQRGEAVKAGAFGGSRQGVLDAELDRATLEQKAQTAAELRRAGFESAAQRAQQAFQDQQARFLSASQLGLGSLAEAGRLGLSSGELGLKGITTGLAGTELAGGLLGDASTRFSDLGSGLSNLGARVAGLRGLDLESLSKMGDLQQAIEQQRLDAEYADRMAAVLDPYKALQIQSDIFKGVPYQQTALNVASLPATARPDRGAGLMGAGIAALGYGLENLGK